MKAAIEDIVPARGWAVVRADAPEIREGYLGSVSSTARRGTLVSYVPGEFTVPEVAVAGEVLDFRTAAAHPVPGAPGHWYVNEADFLGRLEDGN